MERERSGQNSMRHYSDVSHKTLRAGHLPFSFVRIYGKVNT